MNQLTQRIEDRIDKSVTGGVQVFNAAGATVIAPRNLTEVMEFAKLMAISGPAVRPAFRNHVGACLAIALQAFRWGMDPYAVSNKAYVTKSSKTGEEQIAYESQLIHAVVNQNAPLRNRLRATYDGKDGSRSCRIEGLLKGEDKPFVYESPPISQIDPKNSPLWKSDPDQQLWYYSVRAWARRYVPEVIMGVYAEDELAAMEHHWGADNARDVTPARPTRESVAAVEVWPLHNDSGDMITEYTSAGEFSDQMCELIRDPQSDYLALWEANTETLNRLMESRHCADCYDPIEEVYARRLRADEADGAADAEEGEPEQDGEDVAEIIEETEDADPVVGVDLAALDEESFNEWRHEAMRRLATAPTLEALEQRQDDMRAAVEWCRANGKGMTIDMLTRAGNQARARLEQDGA